MVFWDKGYFSQVRDNHGKAHPVSLRNVLGAKLQTRGCIAPAAALFAFTDSQIERSIMTEVEYKPNVTYQHFAKTNEKFAGLNLPPLEGKRFLDMGCNMGFYCRYAKEQGAVRVLGIDNSSKVIAVAREENPGIEFRDKGWDDFPTGPFDVVIWLSAIHYAADPVMTAQHILRNLSPGGVLVLECGVLGMNDDTMTSNFRAPVWREVGDKSHHLTRNFLYQKLLAGFEVEYIGPSVQQDGDPAKRYVFHARKRQPHALLHQASIHEIGYLWTDTKHENSCKIDLLEFVDACLLSRESIVEEHPSMGYYKTLQGAKSAAEGLAQIASDADQFKLFMKDVIGTLEPSSEKVFVFSVPEGAAEQIVRAAFEAHSFFTTSVS